jgi:hypothetical protein
MEYGRGDQLDFRPDWNYLFGQEKQSDDYFQVGNATSMR